MKYGKWGVLASFILVLAGCGDMPRTPDLLVGNAKDGAMLSEKESFVVNKSLGEVAGVLKRKSNECLRRNVSFSAMGDSSGGIRMERRETRKLTPKLHMNGHHARLTVQVLVTEGSTDLGDPPRDGWYMIVVDATAKGAHRTQVDAYYQHTQFHGAYAAIKPWVTGTNMSCPDLTE